MGTTMELKAKSFDELTTTELYEILQARSDIFVLEQTCLYQDMDGTDYDCLHVFYQGDDGKTVTAYLRAFHKEGEPGTVQVGRVLTREHGTGLGGKLLKEALAVIKEKMLPAKITLDAQCYAVGYYEREGFKICSEEFLEDDIPHITMELIL